MRLIARTLLILGGIGMIVLAAGFFFHLPWATQLWLWEDGPLSLTFVAAMQAAIAAAMLWIGISNQLSAMSAGALNLIVMLSGSAWVLFQLSDQEGRGYLIGYATACLVFALFNLFLLVYCFGLPVLDKRPLPGMVRFAFLLYIIALLTLGIYLLRQPKVVFPWPLNADTSLIFGWMFLGDACYFLYALLFPVWANAKAPLWSFLIYDLVLIGPFVAHFAKVLPEHRSSLVVYTIVLVFSALVSIYYLFLRRESRGRVFE